MGVIESAKRFMGLHKPRQRPSAEFGWGGAKVFSGIVLDEYNPDLKGKLGLQTAERMRRTSGQVRAVEMVVRLPIESANWFIEEPKGGGSGEKEAAEYLRQDLFSNLDRSWSDVIREGCLGVHSGTRIPEIVWEEREGRLAVKDLASRNPELLERWQYDADGKLVGYIYAGQKAVGTGAGLDTPTNTYQRVFIPLDNTVHFVFNRENESPMGFGLWRSMYPHWYFYQALLKIMGLGIERNLVGIPVGKQGDGAQADDKAKMLNILRNLRVTNDAAITLPSGWSIEWLESSRNLMDAMPFLHHHNTMMAQVALAQFLSLGQTNVGTQALAKEHTELFQLAEEAHAGWIEETLNRQLIRRWCRLNYGKKLKPPVLRHRKIAARDLGAWTAALNSLVQGEFLHPGKDDESFIRDAMELPAAADEGS